MKKTLKVVFGSLIMMFPFYYSGSVIADDQVVNINTDVRLVMNMSVSENTYLFGNLTPGAPKRGSAGLIISVRTSAADGYNLSIADSVTGTNSAMLHQTDNTTRITDFSGSIDTPASWQDGMSKGLGFTLFAADTNKEEKWGGGVSYNDSNNMYAGIPQNSKVFHSSPGYKAGVDETNISFAVDVPNSQKTGDYIGEITISATAIMP